MSIPVSSLVWKFSSHKSGNLLVLLAIADHADDGGEAWPGIPLLARESRLGERHVRRCLKALESSLELAILPNASRCGGPLYRICLERLKRKAETPTTMEATLASGGEDVGVTPSIREPSEETSLETDSHSVPAKILKSSLRPRLDEVLLFVSQKKDLDARSRTFGGTSAKPADGWIRIVDQSPSGSQPCWLIPRNGRQITTSESNPRLLVISHGKRKSASQHENPLNSPLRQRMDFEMKFWTFDGPDYHNMMNFTQGRWETMTDEEKAVAIDRYVAWLPQKKREMHQERLRERWEQLCPPIYRESDPGLLPNLPMFEEVQKWEYGPTGLLLIGSTRRGKTRAVWALLKRLHFHEERRILAYNPMDLKLAVANAWRDRDEDQEETNLIIRLRDVELLFLDDLDTIKFTEAVEETIYDIFEYRPTHEKPVIVTVNQGGEQLAERMNAWGRGAKIVERMRESCRVVNFGSAP